MSGQGRSGAKGDAMTARPHCLILALMGAVAAAGPARAVQAADPTPLTALNQAAFLKREGSPLAAAPLLGSQTMSAGLNLSAASPLSRREADLVGERFSADGAWPGRLRLASGGYDIEVAPRAGLSWSALGGSARAGAQIQVGPHLESANPIDRLGLAPDRPAAPMDKGRWFLFAQGSGEVLGVHLSRDGRGLLPSAALTLDGDASLHIVSDSQAGVGWRKGAMQASFGYVHREIENGAAWSGTRNPGDIKGDMVAFTFSLRPR